MARRIGLARGAIVLASFAIATPSAATEPGAAPVDVETKARCTAAYESAQVLRREEHLEAARRQLAICRQTCPETLIRDCKKWEQAVEAVMPTVRFVVRDAGGSALGDVRVQVDGHALTDRIDRPIAVEPGAHTFRFERSGSAPAETRVELHAGERDRNVPIVLEPVRAPKESSAEGEAPRSRVLSYVLLGVGGAAAIAAGALAIKGHLDKSDLEAKRCAPYCPHSDVQSIATTWWVAAGLGAFGAVAIGTGMVTMTWKFR